MRKAHRFNAALRAERRAQVEDILSQVKRQIMSKRPQPQFYLPETGCYCAATHAPCSWCTDANRTEQDFNPPFKQHRS